MGAETSEVTRRERIAFAAGDTGYNFVWQTIELYLLFYYVRILGLPPEKAALIFLAGAAVDLAADPIIGALVDRSRKRISARNWMVLAGPPLGLALALGFVPPPVPGAGGISILAALHILLRVTYSLGNIPYATLTSRISAEPAEHVRLTAIRLQGAAIGGFIAALIYLLVPLSVSIGSVPAGAVILGLIAQPLFLWTWKGVTERVTPPDGPNHSLGQQLRGMGELLARSVALRKLLLLIFLAGIACTILYKGLLFVFDQLNARGLGYGVALFPSIILFIGAPTWSALARRIGRDWVMRIASATYCVAVCSAWLAGDILPLVTVCIAVASFASVGMSVMFFAFIPAVIRELERDFVVDGCAARIFGLSNLARKLAQAIAPQIIALSLILPGEGVIRAMVATSVVALLASIWCIPTKDALRQAAM